MSAIPAQHSKMTQRRPPESLWSMTWRRFTRHPMAVTGAIIMLLLMGAIVAAPHMYQLKTHFVRITQFLPLDGGG
ncbi:hypothetical protein FJZ31_34700 [Candidatus Poribacteria bacterium]|nr:hypothetical protein [Candidatus Poribacteria bacterium]